MMTSPNDLKFSVDEPAEAQEFASGEITVRGWAIATEGVLSMRARIGNGSWTDIPSGKPRSDVARAHPTLSKALHSGFSGRIDVIALAPGEYEFELEIRSASGQATEIRRKIEISDAAKSTREAFISLPDDLLRVKLEDPSEHSLTLRESVLRVSGWALAKSGIKQVNIWLNNDGPHAAHYGLMREDIGSLYEEFADASHAGFLWVSPIGHLGPGTHTLHIVCTSTSGASAEVTSFFSIDSKSEYEHWAKLNELHRDQLIDLFERTSTLSHSPKISIITPVFRTPEDFLRKCISSVKKQVYPNWELILVDDCSGDRRLSSLLKNFANQDRRIQTVALPSNAGIAGATNAGIDLATGDYVALLDHDDELSPDALLRVIQALAKDPSIDVLYSDEDKIDEQGVHRDVFFKPDWSPDLLLSMNYVCHFLVCRRSLLQAVGGLRKGFDGSQDYDLILRLSEHTSRIHRVAKVLYHWRMHQHSTALDSGQKPAASNAGRRALEEHLTRTGIKATVIEIGTCRYRVKYDIVGEPEVAVIIPTGGSRTLEAALDSILTVTTYPNYRVVVVDNSSDDRVLQTLSRFDGRGLLIDLLDLRGLPFNFSLLCNKAAGLTKSEYLLFLNDDTTVITPDWIESMLEHAQRQSVGAVGALLLFPNGTIQHAGVVSGLLEIAGHSFRGMPNQPLYFAFPHVIRNCSAVTGACLMTRRDVFEAVNGFDESNLPTCFQDVDLCLKILEKGLRVIYTPFAKLFHYESLSKKAVAELPEVKYMKKRWPSHLTEDPFYNPNLSKYTEYYSLSYDRVFLQADKVDTISRTAARTAGASAVSPGVQTATAKKVGRLGRIDFYASPSATKPIGKQAGRPTVFWNAAGASKVQVRVGSPMGTLFAEGGSEGSAVTGPWISPGTVFYLLDATESSVGSPARVLSVLQV